MQIICNRSTLLNSVNIAQKAVPSKTTMTILECLIISAKANCIKLTANDMELAIETILDGEIKEEGSVAINAKILLEIIRKLPDSEVVITTNEKYEVTIKCEKSKFSIMGKTTDEFPGIPEIKRNNKVTLSQFALKDLIRQTVFSISDTETNKIMTGELFEISESEFKVVSLDGHRISIRKLQLKDSYEPIKVIVSGKALIEINKVLSGGTDDLVYMYFTEKHVIFEFDNTIVVSRLIEGEYYKIDQMLTNDYETKIIANKKELLNCIDRATLLVKENEKKPIIINISSVQMELRMNTSIGSMNEEIDIKKEGKDILIGFNPKFLIDALRVIDDEDVTIYLFNPKAPCFIKDKDETYIYLILPVNFNAGVN
ncbi:DNA polymerase III subunit beta [Anaeromicropila populeti]|uniref:Beta sliding clamp n=1 Tax=Anaeromicropila populeti TaxID=37658 RepID=A0A1I6LMQ6_9FIRM|nr:DNA polymerase III subunit beta [Anaeromicropila populeti]SFS04774.1 DNA polymerase III, beta subunit [Anaeromicropila populeti]